MTNLAKKNKSKLLAQLLKETELIKLALVNEEVKEIDLGNSFSTFNGHECTVVDNKDRIVKRKIFGQTRWTISDWDGCHDMSDRGRILETKLKEKEKELQKLKAIMFKQGQFFEIVAKKLIHEMFKPGGSEFKKAQKRNLGKMKK